MKSSTLISLLLAGLFVCADAAAADAQNLVIQGATLRTPAGDTENITLVVKDGQISAMGTKVQVPKGAKVIAAQGKVLTAGLTATSTRLGLVEINAVGYTNEGRFSSAFPVHAAFRITDGYNPNSIVIDVARNGGITSSITAPGGGLIAGQSAWMSLGDGSVSDNTVSASTAMHVTLGRGATGVGEGSRGRALQKLRALFDDAAHYGKNKAAYNRGQTRKYGAGHLDLEALQSVLQRRIPLVVSVDRQSDIAAVLKLAKEFKIRVVLQGATEAWMLADELAAAKVPVIVNPKQNLPSSFDQVNVVDDAATRLARAGVQVIISPSGDASSARTLRQLAGLAVAHGMPWKTALAAITSTPASVFGVKRGTPKVGAIADLVLWSGDPLELSTLPEHIFIGGVEQSMENHQTKLRDRYR
jgi:imidazolonepropionase-like amidohydrolase